MQAITKVFSDIVKPYIDEVKQTLTQQINENGAKNLLDSVLGYGSSQRGVDFTKNADGSINIPAVTTGNQEVFTHTMYSSFNVKIPYKAGKKYIFSIGTSASYFILQIFYKTSTVDWRILDEQSNVSSVNFTMPSDVTDIWLRVRIPKNTSISATTIYPMVRLASDSDDTYEPYAKSNKELTEDVTPEYFDLSVRSSRVSIVAQKNCRIGKQVYLWCRFTPIVSGDIIPAFSVPSGYRPPNVSSDSGIIIGMVAKNTSADFTIARYALVFASGEIDVVNVAQDGDYMIYGSYFID